MIPFLLETAHQLILYYRNLPNKGIGHSSKVKSDRLFSSQLGFGPVTDDQMDRQTESNA